MPELDESDREIIRRETTRKLYLVIICSLAAAVQ